MWKAGLIDLSELICFVLPALPPSLLMQLLLVMKLAALESHQK